LTFSAFYDKALSPEERMENVSIVRAILKTWKGASVKGKAVTKNFITTPTYEDIITGIEGLIMYMILNTTKLPNSPLSPGISALILANRRMPSSELGDA
jgi:hypothetical protein